MRRLAVPVLVLVGLAACDRASPAPPPSPPGTQLRPGEIAQATPETFKTTLRSFRGRPVVVNYWASWCGPCEAEMPRFVAAAKRYGSQVAFLGVDVEDHAAEARAFAQRTGINFPSLADPMGDIKRDQRLTGLPTTQFYRADGGLAFSHAGEIDEEQIEKNIRELLRVGTPVTPGADG